MEVCFRFWTNSIQSTCSAFLMANGFSGGVILQSAPGTIEGLQAAFPVLGLFQNMLGHWQRPSTAGLSRQFLLQAMKISTFSHNSWVQANSRIASFPVNHSFPERCSSGSFNQTSCIARPCCSHNVLSGTANTVFSSLTDLLVSKDCKAHG